MISFGIVSNYFGGKFFGHIVTVASAIVTFIAVSLIFSIIGGYKVFNQDVGAGWYVVALLCFIVSVAAGAGMSYVTWKWKRAGAAYFGFCVGFFVGFFIYNLIFAKLFTSKFVAFMIVAAFSTATAYYSFIWSKTLTVPTTAAIGSYAMIYGVNMFVGGLPDSVADYKDSAERFFEDASYITYLFVFVILMVSGVLHQRYRKYHTAYDNEFTMHSLNDDNYMNQALK